MKSIVKITMLVLLLSLWAVPGVQAQSDDQTGSQTYEVTITNLTDKQTLSPALLATHNSSLHVWEMGGLASEGVRLVAEQGMEATLASELEGKATTIQRGPNPLMPGQSITLRISGNEGDVLSAAMMLGQTNDTFTGLDSVDLAPGTMETMAYDAGTEENTELASDVPGAPFMGMNRPATDPQAPITQSQGIRGDQEIDSSYDWEGAAARFQIRAVTADMPTAMPQTGRGVATSSTIAVLLGATVIFLLGIGGVRRAVQPR